MENIYLDYAAATPLDSKVLNIMMPSLKDRFANPSSAHALGTNIRDVVESSRKSVAKQLNCLASEIIFTSSGTEANNLALFGAMGPISKKGHLIISSIEHKSILEPARRLLEMGYSVTQLNVDRFGLINLKHLNDAIDKHTRLVSIIYGNNEIGTIQNVRAIARIIKRYKNLDSLPLFHIDACQAPGLIDIDVNHLGVDLMTLNGSKIYGPKGIGVLYKKKSIDLTPLIYGGGQEMGMRSGTENVAAIVGFTEALVIAIKNKDSNVRKLRNLRAYLIKRLIKTLPSATINSQGENTLPSIINVCIHNIDADHLVMELSNRGIYVSSGSACSAGDSDISHVLQSIGLSEANGRSSIRISIGRYTTKSELNMFLMNLVEICGQCRNLLLAQ